MNAMSPMAVGTFVQVEVNDENDPESSLIAHLVTPAGSDGEPADDTYKELGNSFGAERKDFLWMVRCFAQFHNIAVVGVTE